MKSESYFRAVTAIALLALAYGSIKAHDVVAIQNEILDLQSQRINQLSFRVSTLDARVSLECDRKGFNLTPPSTPPQSISIGLEERSDTSASAWPAYASR